VWDIVTQSGQAATGVDARIRFSDNREERMNSELLDCLVELAQAEGLDAVALVPGPNLLHLTGYSFHLSERPTLAVIPVDQPPVMVVPALEAGKVSELEVFSYTDEEGYAMAFHEACVALELADARIGVEALRMRLLEARLLERYAAGSRLVPADELLSQLRVQKSSLELAAMRRAIAVAEAAFLGWLADVHPGMTEREATARLVARLLTSGADAISFDPIVVGGPNGALPHAVPGSRPLAYGDWLVVDWGAFVEGYASDLTRAVTMGPPAGPLCAVQELVLRANEAGRAAARPGIAAEAVDAAARAVITAAGHGEHFTHRTGHGLGLEVHEPPYIVAGNTGALLPGMTFTVEPGVYLEGVGGVRIEDNVVITAVGAETLSTLPRAPFVVHA